MTSLVSSPNISESCDPLDLHPFLSPLFFLSPTKSSCSSQIALIKYAPQLLMANGVRSIAITAASKCSLKSAGYYAIYYDTLPYFHSKTLKKWMQNVAFCLMQAD